MLSELILRFGCSKLALKLRAAVEIGIEELNVDDLDPCLKSQVDCLSQWFKSMPTDLSASLAWEILLNAD